MFEMIKTWLCAVFRKKTYVEKVEVVEVAEVAEPDRRYITWHAKKRFQERHGIVMTDEQAQKMVEVIESKEAEFISESHNGTEEWIAKYQGTRYRIIYSIKDKIIVTVYSGIKNKNRKPSRKNKRPKNRGKQQRKLDRKPQPLSYKRTKRVRYEEAI